MSQENQFFNDDNTLNSEENNNQKKNIESENSDTVYFGENDNSENTNGDGNNGFSNNSNPKTEKPKKKISIKNFVIAIIAAILATVMLTYSICNSIFQSMYAKAYLDANQNSHLNGNISMGQISELDIISRIIQEVEYHDVDQEKMMTAAIKAYVEATGDIFAAYYTEEELNQSNDDSVGKMVGIGVKIINDKMTYNGEEIWGLNTVNIMLNSPAEEIGMKVGDFVFRIYVNDKAYNIKDIGYDEALDLLLGEAGTKAKFTALRKNGDAYEEITFEPTRREITTTSVYYHVAKDLDPNGKIGIVKIEEFDYTTPTQFTTAIDTMKASGCEKFIIDVRNNLGGLGDSIHAVLSYFLNEGDVYVRIKDKNGEITSEKIAPVSNFSGDQAGCNVKKEEIGKYKGLDIVVVSNELTVSAAELFVANVKDYKLGTVVGTKTFGKGTMQVTYDLEQYGLYLFGVPNLKGALQVTAGAYMSAFSDNYDKIGIEPDVNQPLTLTEEEQKQYTIYTIPDNLDDQLVEAIKHFKSN